jgi:neurotransmitter:Na+ symporter, NSS family
MANRGNFSGRIGFILAAAGSAVGLGNIWRFPYLAGQNGGAVFLLIYLICIFTLCYPVMVGEVAIGRAAQRDAFGSYTRFGGPKWGWLGFMGILAGIFILSFYNVVAGWAFGYFLNITFGDLLNQSDFSAFFGSFVNDILDVSSLKGLAYSNFLFSLIFMAFTAVIVSQGIQKGIEAANKIMMPSLYIILIGLIIYSLTLPNAMDGVRFYLIPDFSKISMGTISASLKQAFFSLSLGMGALITYGSYLGKQEKISGSAAIISTADTSVAFLAGLMVFPLVFSQGIDPATRGPELVFIALPQVFVDMGPVVGRIVGGSFFLLLCFAALTSTVSLLEVPVAYFVDQKKYNRKATVWGLAAFIFVAGLPSMMSQGMIPSLNKLSFYGDRDFLTFVSDISDLFLTIGGCLMCVFIRHRWKLHNMHDELELGDEGFKGRFVRKYLDFTISWVCPILLGVLSFIIILENFFGVVLF